MSLRFKIILIAYTPKIKRLSWLFELRGKVPSKFQPFLELGGFLIFIFIWFLLTVGAHPIVPSGLLPSPMKVLSSFGDLYTDNNLVKNTFYSIGLNLSGYAVALALTIPIGFAIGLYPIFRGAFQRLIVALRFTPLAAVIGLFIVWFGIDSDMKYFFLGFGIFIFMLPVVVQRIDEVKDVYLKTVYTIGATDWQTIKTVYFPSVFSRFFDDLRVLTAISWTYIVVAEGVGSQGGLGNLLIYGARRQGRMDKVFAIIILIIVIGIIQDKVFKMLDKEFFPHKYQIKDKYAKAKDPGIFESILSYATSSLIWLLLATYVWLAINEICSVIGNVKVLSYLFTDTQWVIHLIFILIITYKGYHFIKDKTVKSKPKLKDGSV